MNNIDTTDILSRYKGLSAQESPVIDYAGKTALISHVTQKTASLIDTASGSVVWASDSHTFDERIELIKRAAERDELTKFIIPHIITTNSPDRVNDVIEIGGGELENYKANPIVAYGHMADCHVGNSKRLIRSVNEIVSHTWFHCFNSLSVDIAKLSLSGVMPAVSIGFIPKKWEDETLTTAQQASGEFYPSWSNTKRNYTKWELLEYSIVPIPMNPQAVEQRQVDDAVREAVTRGIIASDSAVCKALTGRVVVKSAPPSAVGKTDNNIKVKAMDEKVQAAVTSITQGAVDGLVAMDAAGEGRDGAGVDILKALALGSLRIGNDLVGNTTDESVIALCNGVVKASKTVIAACNEILAKVNGGTVPEPTDTSATDPVGGPADAPSTDPTVQLDADLAGVAVKGGVVKAGAVLNAANKQLVQGAIDNLTQVLTNATPADSGKGIVDAKTYESDMRAVTATLGEMKTMIETISAAKSTDEPKPKRKRLAEVL